MRVRCTGGGRSARRWCRRAPPCRARARGRCASPCAPRAGAPASAARARSSRPRAGRSCPCRGDARCRRARRCSSAGRMVQQRVQHRAGPVAAARMHDQSRGLVHDEDVAVLVDDVERDRLGPEGRLLLGAGASDTSTASPLFTLRLPGTFAPSTRTCPSSMRRARRLRDSSGSSRASAWSSRSPASAPRNREAQLPGDGGGRGIIRASRLGIHHESKCNGIGRARSSPLALGGCSLFGKVMDPHKDWQAAEYYKAAQGASSTTRTGTRHQALRAARGEVPIRPLRAAGAARDAPTPTTSSGETAQCVSHAGQVHQGAPEPPERRLRAVPEGARQLQGRPRAARRALISQDLADRDPEGRARVVRGLQGPGGALSRKASTRRIRASAWPTSWRPSRATR